MNIDYTQCLPDQIYEPAIKAIKWGNFERLSLKIWR